MSFVDGAGEKDRKAFAGDQKRGARCFGCTKGAILIKGDIVSPLPEDDWEVLSS
jgi:hypothetical protein